MNTHKEEDYIEQIQYLEHVIQTLTKENLKMFTQLDTDIVGGNISRDTLRRSLEVSAIVAEVFRKESHVVDAIFHEMQNFLLESLAQEDFQSTQLANDANALDIKYLIMVLYHLFTSTYKIGD